MSLYRLIGACNASQKKRQTIFVANARFVAGWLLCFLLCLVFFARFGFAQSYYTQAPQLSLLATYSEIEEPSRFRYTPIYPPLEPYNDLFSTKMGPVALDLPNQMPQNTPYQKGFWAKVTSSFSDQAALRDAIDEYLYGDQTAGQLAFQRLSGGSSQVALQAKAWNAWAYTDQKIWPESVVYWRALLEQADQNLLPIVVYFYSVSLDAIGDSTTAFQQLDRFLLEEPRFDDGSLFLLHFWLGTKVGAYDLAEFSARKFEQSYPYSAHYADFLVAFGDFLAAQKKNQQAIKRYREVWDSFLQFDQRPALAKKILWQYFLAGERDLFFNFWKKIPPDISWEAGEKEFFSFYVLLLEKEYPQAQKILANFEPGSAYFLPAYVLAAQNLLFLRSQRSLLKDSLLALKTSGKQQFYIDYALGYLAYEEQDLEQAILFLQPWWSAQNLQAQNNQQTADLTESSNFFNAPNETLNRAWLQFTYSQLKTAVQTNTAKAPTYDELTGASDFGVADDLMYSDSFAYSAYYVAAQLYWLYTQQNWQEWLVTYENKQTVLFVPYNPNPDKKQVSRQALTNVVPNPFLPAGSEHFWNSTPSTAVSLEPARVSKVPLSFVQEKQLVWMQIQVLAQTGKLQAALSVLGSYWQHYQSDYARSLRFLYQYRYWDEVVQIYETDPKIRSLKDAEKEAAAFVYLQSLYALNATKAGQKFANSFAWSKEQWLAVQMFISVQQQDPQMALLAIRDFQAAYPTQDLSYGQSLALAQAFFTTQQFFDAYKLFEQSAQKTDVKAEQYTSLYNAWICLGFIENKESFWQIGSQLLKQNLSAQTRYQIMVTLTMSFRFQQKAGLANDYYNNYFSLLDYQKFSVGLYWLANLIELEQYDQAQELIQWMLISQYSEPVSSEQWTEFWLMSARAFAALAKPQDSLALFQRVFPLNGSYNPNNLLANTTLLPAYKKDQVLIALADAAWQTEQTEQSVEILQPLAQKNPLQLGTLFLEENYYLGLYHSLRIYDMLTKKDEAAFSELEEKANNFAVLRNNTKIYALAAKLRFAQKKYLAASLLQAKAVFQLGKQATRDEINRLVTYMQAANLTQDALAIAEYFVITDATGASP